RGVQGSRQTVPCPHGLSDMRQRTLPWGWGESIERVKCAPYGKSRVEQIGKNAQTQSEVRCGQPFAPLGACRARAKLQRQQAAPREYFPGFGNARRVDASAIDRSATRYGPVDEDTLHRSLLPHRTVPTRHVGIFPIATRLAVLTERVQVIGGRIRQT